MNYTEKRETTYTKKVEYKESILSLIEKLQAQEKEKRNGYIKDIMADIERYRSEFANMLGFPLDVMPEKELPQVSCEKLSDEGEYSVYRMQIEVLKEHSITGLFFKHNDDELRPFAVVQHGALGTPELISGVYGSTANYNNMLQRVLKRGINVFAPQMLLWSDTEYELENQRAELDMRLKRVGSSIMALEAYSVIRIIDYFAAQEYTGRIGMVGLSYGGFFTQVVSALDTRIDAAVTCSFFCDGDDYIFADLCREKDISRFGHAELACLVHPRKMFIEMGMQDELFDYKKSEKEIERIKEICKNDCSDWLNFIAFEGNHEFYKGDEHLDDFAACLKQEVR